MKCIQLFIASILCTNLYKKQMKNTDQYYNTFKKNKLKQKLSEKKCF